MVYSPVTTGMANTFLGSTRIPIPLKVIWPSVSASLPTILEIYVVSRKRKTHSRVARGHELRVLCVVAVRNGSEVVNNSTARSIDFHATVASKVPHEIRGVAVEHDKHASMEVDEIAELFCAQTGIFLVRIEDNDDVVEQILSILRDLELLLDGNDREDATLG